MANCDAKVLFRAGSEQDARYFEELGGKGTFLSKNAGRTKSSRDEGTSSSFSERERPVWMAGDLLQRDPAKDGVLLFQNPTGDPKMMGKFEVPIRNMEEVPFLAEELGTVGDRGFEEGVIAAELDRLDASARKRMADASPDAWTPGFGRKPSSDDGGEPSAEDLLGF